MKRREKSTFRDIIVPVVKGLAGLADDSSGPLVEVAMEALLNRDLQPKERERYLLRVECSGSTEQIYKLIMAGCTAEDGERLANAFSTRYGKELDGIDRKMSIALGEARGLRGEAGAIDPRRSEYFGNIVLDLMSKRMGHVDVTVRHAFEVLYMGKLERHEAQKTMALLIMSEGTKEQAQELLERGSVTGINARSMLVFKCYEKPQDRAES